MSSRAALAVATFALACAPPRRLPASEGAAGFATGVDASYALEMEAAGRAYTHHGAPVDVFEALARAGVDALRVRLWTRDEGVNGLDYAVAMAQRGQAAGMRPYVVIFLSDGWSDLVKQPAPGAWRELALADKAAAVEAYAARVARRFAEAGVPIDVYEVGNEIDFGVCGEFEEAWPNRVSLEYMSTVRWPAMATILAAAQRGVRSVDPDAKFIVHLAQWDNVAYTLPLWRSLIDAGVAVDFAGLSYFPTSAPEGRRGLDALLGQAASIRAALDRPVVLAEYAYPSAAAFEGQFASWNQPAPGYPLDEAGQAAWVRDLLAAARASEDLAGAWYWSPEWLGSGMWDAFAWFRPDGSARPALDAVRAPRPTRSAPR
jgi:arabinogalactan endo-1,4-beta-galactosidase